MAQSQTTTNQGYGELGKLVAGEAASAVQSVVCYEDACAAASEASTYASPAATKITDSGLDIADADTVVSAQTTVAADTIQLDHQFTASGTKTVTGFGVCNDEDDVLYAECCFNAGIAMESSDTLDVQMKIQFKAD